MSSIRCLTSLEFRKPLLIFIFIVEKGVQLCKHISVHKVTSPISVSVKSKHTLFHTTVEP